MKTTVTDIREPHTLDEIDLENDVCPNCGGDGVIYICEDEIGCVDPESGCKMCERRCDWCRPRNRSPQVTAEPEGE